MTMMITPATVTAAPAGDTGTDPDSDAGSGSAFATVLAGAGAGPADPSGPVGLSCPSDRPDPSGRTKPEGPAGSANPSDPAGSTVGTGPTGVARKLGEPVRPIGDRSHRARPDSDQPAAPAWPATPVPVLVIPVPIPPVSSGVSGSVAPAGDPIAPNTTTSIAPIAASAPASTGSGSPASAPPAGPASPTPAGDTAAPAETGSAAALSSFPSTDAMLIENLPANAVQSPVAGSITGDATGPAVVSARPYLNRGGLSGPRPTADPKPVSEAAITLPGSNEKPSATPVTSAPLGLPIGLRPVAPVLTSAEPVPVQGEPAQGSVTIAALAAADAERGSSDAGQPSLADRRKEPISPSAAKETGPMPAYPPSSVIDPTRMAPTQPAGPNGPLTTEPPVAPNELAAPLIRLRSRGDGDHELTLALHPADLGPVNVHVRLSGSEMTIQLASGNDSAHAALRDALPQLRAELHNAGLSSHLELSLDVNSQSASADSQSPSANSQSASTDSQHRSRNERPEPVSYPAELPNKHRESRSIRPSDGLDRWL